MGGLQGLGGGGGKKEEPLFNGHRVSDVQDKN